ncbi:MAG: sugar kinase [Chloroflexi bacterium]|nr:sugar kinase [Chloroflexota bacterium]
MPDVVTFGETMALFTPRETGPLRYVADFRLKLGGTESNFAAALVRLGVSAGWFSRLGDDELGRFIAHHLRGEGIDLSRVIFDQGAPTGLYVKEISAVGETSVYYYRRGSAASRMTPEDLDTGYITGARWLHVTGITPALSESCRETVERAVDLAREAGLEVSFDPNLRLKLWSIEEARAGMFPIVARSTVLLGGMEELGLLLDTDSPDAAADWALEQGVRIAVIKLGAEGALVATPAERRTVPPFKIARIVDTIGAGDGFDAGFVAGRLLGRDPWQSAELGNVVGAHALMVEGDYEGYPTMAEVEAFLAGRARISR